MIRGISVEFRRRVVCVAVLTAGLAFVTPAYGQSCAVPKAPALKPGAHFLTYVPLNVVGVRVLDENGRAVVGLAYKDFRIFEDGEPQEIALFDRPGQIWATCIGILIDRSTTRQEVLPNSEIGPAQQFLQSIVDMNHAASVSAFNNKTIPIAAYSNDPITLKSEVHHLESFAPADGRALYDAIAQAAQSISSMRGHRILVVIAQADDNESRTTAADAIEAVMKANTAVYFIQLHSPALNLNTQYPDRFTKEITSSTGGELFSVKSQADIDAAFEAIKEALSSLYEVGYVPSMSLTTGIHELEVRTKRKHLHVVAPTRFYVSNPIPIANPQK